MTRERHYVHWRPGERNRIKRQFRRRERRAAALSVDRAISWLRLLSKLSSVFQGQPFVYPSPGDSLTIESITKKGRLTIIHDSRGTQLIQTTLPGVSSAWLRSSAEEKTAAAKDQFAPPSRVVPSYLNPAAEYRLAADFWQGTVS